MSPLFFPSISENVRKELENGGFVLDIGAFNGAWGSEMLARFPNANGIFFEPNPEKCFNINKTINRSNLTSKSILIDAGIAKSTGHAWQQNQKTVHGRLVGIY